ncbi:DNA repair and recombination protein RAD54B [[Emmonsia] crescens]|uniref:DNA repair and recombination protein RAD54B n=1 Tax=[Emmonsia] crescens TaxID=73230 RepID=A0A0G2IAZ1_9EURO|nr:DNA repair and recombination protein RAD54B [Emmonsia crescens UAMH 3008]
MPFKPFRPPLVKKSPPTSASSLSSNFDDLSRDSGHISKRRRISTETVDLTVNDDDDDDDNDNDNENGKYDAKSEYVPRVPRQGSKFRDPDRKPLIPKWNPPMEVDVDYSGMSTRDGGMETYYNVLWRKPTAKKHKTWDGDGILIVRGGYASLQDISGRDFGRIMFNSPLLPCSTLSVGGKEVEVDSVLSKKEYLSGRAFLATTKPSPSTIPIDKDMENPRDLVRVSRISSAISTNGTIRLPPKAKIKREHGDDEGEKRPLNIAAPRSFATKNAFKNPLKASTVLVQKPNGNPIPRHDPTTPGAVIMKRPTSVPKGKQIVDVVLDPLLGKHLREHQREGVKFLYECVMGMRPFNGEGAILADEMGLGKTLQTIALIWTLLKQNPIYEAQPVIKKALIVCPVTLIDNWKKEFRKWLGNERIGVFVADAKRTRLTDFTMGKSYSVMIIGYERLRTVQEELTKGSGIDIVIADEGHRMRTVQNKSAQAIQSLNTSRRIILSGTPIQNDLTEFFAMVDFVNPGLLGTFKMFMKEFDGPIVKSRQPGALKKDIEKGEARSEELANLTSLFILRRTAEILSKYLPPKTEYVLFCNPTSSQKNIYRHVLTSPVFQRALGNSESALQLITILKKLCNSPSLLNPRNSDEASNSTLSALVSSLPSNILRHLSPASSGKIRVLDQLLHNISHTTSEKVVLISNYTSTLDLLATLLTSLSLPFLRLDGSTPAAKRQGLVDDFNRSSSSAVFAFLLSAKAGGTGLNLIGASRLVLFDVDWNPATDMQAMARIHRDGQKRHCRIYRFVLKGALEEKIWQRQVTKIGLADSVMDQKSGVSQFSREELKDLFRLDEGATCQTHDLLGCECGGRGGGEIPSNLPEANVIDISKSDNESELSDLDAEDDQSIDFTKLIKASELQAPSSENVTARARGNISNKSRKRKSKMLSLMQYSHIDTSRLCAPSSQTSEDLDSAYDKELKAHVDDDVLLSLLKEEGNGVGFLFKKCGSSGIPLSSL